MGEKKKKKQKKKKQEQKHYNDLFDPYCFLEEGKQSLAEKVIERVSDDGNYEPSRAEGEQILEEIDIEQVIGAEVYEVSQTEGEQVLKEIDTEQAIDAETCELNRTEGEQVLGEIDIERMIDTRDYQPSRTEGEIELGKLEKVLAGGIFNETNTILLVEDLNSFEVDKNKEQTEQREQKKADKFLEDAEKVCAYEIAQRVLKRNRFTYIDSPEGHGATIYRYDGKIWRQRSNEDLMHDVYQVLTQEEKEQHGAIENFCKHVKDFIQKETRVAYDQKKYHFTESDFRKVENRIVFQNGIYDCYTREFLKFDCNLPYIMAVDADYIEYDAPTDTYDGYKESVTDGDVETQNLIDYMIGYLLIANRSGKCMFCIGPARDTGKSTLGRFIKGCVDGRRVSEMNFDNRSNRFILDKADETAIYMCLEMSTDELDEKHVALLKRLTGEYTIQKESKYQSAQDIPNRSKILLATNGGIYLKGSQYDPAFYRRLIVIPFVRSTPVDEIRGDLFDLLESERSAILSKVARKLSDIIEGDGTIFFPESEAGSRMKAEWSRSVYGEDRYYEDAIIYTGKLEDRISRSSLYEGYKIYFKINLATEKRAMMLDEKSFESKIKAIEPKIQSKRARCYDELQGREKNVMVYHGLKWNQEWLEIFQREYQSNSNS